MPTTAAPAAAAAMRTSGRLASLRRALAQQAQVVGRADALGQAVDRPRQVLARVLNLCQEGVGVPTRNGPIDGYSAVHLDCLARIRHPTYPFCTTASADATA